MDLQKGDKVFLMGRHQWANHTGTLSAEVDYGPLFNRKHGWLIDLDNGGSCYAQLSEFSKVLYTWSKRDGQ